MPLDKLLKLYQFENRDLILVLSITYSVVSPANFW
jgi:hypothetical protein